MASGEDTGLRRGCGQGKLPAHRRSPKLWEVWVGPEGLEEQGTSTVFLRISQGMVRNASPQLHLDPWRPMPRVEPGSCLFAGFLGNSELEGLGPNLVNGN